ncbi:MAG TPA: M3 family oligoendopeptidase [Nitrososphaerales archaeon]|nr:M3 family oligoendopeptidase [Nitrososphaerales archaeon]
MAQAIKSEGEYIAANVLWNLNDVLPARSGKIFQSSVLDLLEGLVVEFENMRSNLNDSVSGEQLQVALEHYEKIARLSSRIGSYAYMHFSEDTKSQEARTFKARAEEINADTSNRTLFFELWWKSLDAKKSEELISKSGQYSYYLRRLIHTKPYTLSEQVEQAINLKDVTGRSALLQIYHQIRDSFTYEVTLDTGSKTMTEEQVRDLFHSKNKTERKAAYQGMLQRFDQNRDVLGEIYKMLVRDWRNEGIKLRRYASPISIRNISNDVPDEAVNAVLKVCKANAPLFQRFFKLKAKVLGLTDFSRTDVYAPLPVGTEKKYSWHDGMKLVLGTFESFDGKFASMASKLFSQLHIDAGPREGKLGGAYCMSVTPEITPYVLLSYTGTPRSVATLAHELGHAIHDQLSAQRNNQLTFEPPLPLAETASVFGELLLTDKMLSEANEETRKSLLVDMVNDSYATILRQAFFVLFELDAHESIAKGTNIDDLRDLYLSNLKTQFGDSLSIPAEFGYEWLSIPHIYQTPFYCYSYAWGNLLVLSLYRQFKKEGAKPFAPKYMKLLSYGGSESPEKILNESGFDIRSEKFWQSGFDELAGTVSELEKLL